MIHRIADRYPWHLMQMQFPFSEEGVSQATEAAMAMRCIKATIVPAH